jgi:hypothetical protein
MPGSTSSRGGPLLLFVPGRGEHAAADWEIFNFLLKIINPLLRLMVKNAQIGRFDFCRTLAEKTYFSTTTEPI